MASDVNGSEHCSLDALPSRLDGRFEHLVVSATYEERALQVWQTLRSHVRGRKFVCHNANHSSYLKERVDAFRTEDPKSELVSLNSDLPLQTFDAIREMIEDLRKSGPCHVAIDLTGFTREALAILLYLGRQQLVPGSTMVCVYHKAGGYGRSPGGGWLSQGVREIRSVLGYSGQMRLGAECHLVLLPGFEVERAKEIVDVVRPTRISLGNAPAARSVSGELHDVATGFLRRLEALSSGTAMDKFEFSSVDPYFTKGRVLEIVDSSVGKNVVLACLNAKPATVGACLAAMERPATQLVYAQPIAYNIGAYSTPSQRALFFTVAV